VYSGGVGKNNFFGAEIPVGTVFSGTIGDHTGLFLRAFDIIVLLDNPQKTWTDNATVQNYRRHNAEIVVTE